jgi:hypothetical protein
MAGLAGFGRIAAVANARVLCICIDRDGGQTRRKQFSNALAESQAAGGALAHASLLLISLWAAWADEDWERGGELAAVGLANEVGHVTADAHRFANP